MNVLKEKTFLPSDRQRNICIPRSTLLALQEEISNHLDFSFKESAGT